MRFNESSSFSLEVLSEEIQAFNSTSIQLLIHANFHLLHLNAAAFVLLDAVRGFSHFDSPFVLATSLEEAKSFTMCGDYINCNIIFTFNFISLCFFLISVSIMLFSFILLSGCFRMTLLKIPTHSAVFLFLRITKYLNTLLMISVLFSSEIFSTLKLFMRLNLKA